MKKFFKRALAAVLTVAAMCSGMVGLTAHAYINRYSLITPYTSSGKVYFGVTVTNKSGYVSSFNSSGLLYNNVTDVMYGSLAATSGLYELAVGNNVTDTLSSYEQYSNMPDQTRCELHVSCYYGSVIPSYGVAYETYVGNSYYNK